MYRLDPNECSAAVGSCDAHFARAPKLKQPMAAFDINSPSAALGFAENSALTMCFRLAFSPVLCEADFVLSFSAYISFYAIGYVLRV